MPKRIDDVYQAKDGSWYARVNGRRRTLNTQAEHWRLFREMKADTERLAILNDEEDAPSLQGLEVIVLRGVPGCGKTTWAKEFIKARPWYKRVGRDILRQMFDFGEYDSDNEKFIRHMRKKIIRECLGEGHSVISDDTNLKERDIRDIKDAAEVYSHVIGVRRFVAVPIRIVEFDTPLEECIRRDAERTQPVGADRITEMYNKYYRVVSKEDMEAMRWAVEGIAQLLAEDWQEPWSVIDATTDNLLTIWYPDRNEQAYIVVPDDTYYQYALENFDSRVRAASTMPRWARWRER